MNKFFTAGLLFIFTLSAGQQALASEDSDIEGPWDFAFSKGSNAENGKRDREEPVIVLDVENPSAQKKLRAENETQGIPREPEYLETLHKLDEQIRQERQSLQVSFLILCARKWSKDSSWCDMDKDVLNQILRLSHNDVYAVQYAYDPDFLSKCAELSKLMPFKRVVDLDCLRYHYDDENAMNLQKSLISGSALSLEEIRFPGDGNMPLSDLEIIAQKCKKLKSLQLANWINLEGENEGEEVNNRKCLEAALLSIFQNNPQLTAFVFIDPQFSNILHSNADLRRTLMTRMRNLAIDVTPQVSALMVRAAEGMSSLEELNLCQEEENDLNEYIPFLRVCRNLKSISTDALLTLGFCEALALYCPDLHTINFSCASWPEEDGEFGDSVIVLLAKSFKNLKALHLPDEFSEDITDVSAYAIAEHCKELEELSIPYSRITEAGNLALRNGCQKLRMLNVRYNL